MATTWPRGRATKGWECGSAAGCGYDSPVVSTILGEILPDNLLKFLALKGCALRSKSVWLISVPTVNWNMACLKIWFQNHRKIPWLMIDPC